MAENEILTEEIEDENFIEDAEYSPKSEFSKPLKVSEAMSRCLELRAKPMEPGYDNTTQSNDGTLARSKVPDARQAYISSVIALRKLLTPECKRDSNYMKFDSTFKDKLNKLFDLYAYEEMDVIGFNNGVPLLKKNGRKFIPENDAILKTDVFDNSKRALSRLKGYWNANVNAYWDKCVDLYDDMFAELNLVIDRLNYFKQKSSY